MPIELLKSEEEPLSVVGLLMFVNCAIHQVHPGRIPGGINNGSHATLTRSIIFEIRLVFGLAKNRILVTQTGDGLVGGCWIVRVSYLKIPVMTALSGHGPFCGLAVFLRSTRFHRGQKTTAHQLKAYFGAGQGVPFRSLTPKINENLEVVFTNA